LSIVMAMIGSRRKRIILFLTLCLLITSALPAEAGTWEPPWKFQRNIVNHNLTLQKVRELESKALTDKKSLALLKSATKQRVFWAGYVEEFFYQDGYFFILLHIGDDYAWVLADDTVRNLDFNRKGFKMGFKGSIVLDKKNRLYYLDAWSTIILRPPREQEFALFQEKSPLPCAFQFNTPRSIYTVESPLYPFIHYWIKLHNPHYTDSMVTMMAKCIIYYSYNNSIDPRLMASLFTIESAMDIDAVSLSGAIGLGQLMPGTASGLGVDPRNIAENIGGSAKYLGSLLKMWEGRGDPIGLALASYNAGPGNVSRYGGVPPFSETVNYVYFIKYLFKEMGEQTKNLSPVISVSEEKKS
jgi:hypothetical protein